MLSRAEIRLCSEHALRVVVLAALATMFWKSFHQNADMGGRTLSARGVSTESLKKWSTQPTAPSGIQIQLDSMPSRLERKWLAALEGAGSRVSWSGDLAALMVGAEPVASPAGGTKVFIGTRSGPAVVIGDDVGVIDTVRASNAGASLMVNSVAGEISARVNGSAASTVQRDSLVLHRILVIGSAGWESKFVIAALEEEGWKVDALVRVAPGVDVTQGASAVIDTARYSAVIALDGTVAPYAGRIIQFARMGGGVILAPAAATLEAMTPLRAGVPARAALAPIIASSGSVSLATLPLVPITSLRGDAVALDKRGGDVAVAAMRIGIGRSVQIGYQDTWRWRMTGSDAAVQDHRDWWTGLVSDVAYAPRIPRPAAVGVAVDEAPMIGLVAAIGKKATVTPRSTFSDTVPDWMALLFVILSLALLAEIASRRLRGAS